MMRRSPKLSWKSKPLQRLAVAGVLTLQGLIPLGMEKPAEAGERPDPCLSDALCRAHYQRARTYSRDGEHEAALTAYRTAYRRRSASWLLLSIGRTLHKLGRPKEALAQYQQYSEQNPSGPPELEARLKEYLSEVQEELGAAPPSEEPGPAAAALVNKAAAEDGSDGAAPADGPAAPEVNAPSVAVPRLPTQLALTPATAPPLGGIVEPRKAEKAVSRGPQLGFTLGLTGAFGIAALGSGIAAIQSADRAAGTLFVGAQPSAEAQSASDRSRTLALTTDILLGAGATTLVIGMLATFLRKSPRPPAYALSVSGRGAALAWSWSSP